MGFFDRFKRKKPLTPAELREIMEKLSVEIGDALFIADPSKKDEECKRLLIVVDQTMARVKATLASVEADLEDLMGRTWWATQEAVGRDIRGLRKGRETLLAAQEELSKMNDQIFAVIRAKIGGEGGLGQSEPSAD